MFLCRYGYFGAVWWLLSVILLVPKPKICIRIANHTTLKSKSLYMTNIKFTYHLFLDVYVRLFPLNYSCYQLSAVGRPVLTISIPIVAANLGQILSMNILSSSIFPFGQLGTILVDFKDHLLVIKLKILDWGKIPFCMGFPISVVCMQP